MSEVTICLSFMDQIVNQRTFYSIYHKVLLIYFSLKIFSMVWCYSWFIANGISHGCQLQPPPYYHIYTSEEWTRKLVNNGLQKNRTSTNFVILEIFVKVSMKSCIQTNFQKNKFKNFVRLHKCLLTQNQHFVKKLKNHI